MARATVSSWPAFADRRWTALLALGLVAVVLALSAQPAGAVIVPALTIDGPSEDIVGFGGVAMAEDGTGGLVYLKRVGGVAHVFVARYAQGRWHAPIRVDTGQSFAASWPRIGAADGGELLVVWATPFATERQRPVNELLGATLGPGSASFGQATIVDPDIREGAGTSPDLAMSSTGQADVVYRVVNFQESVPLLRAGDVVETVRVASYDGERWSSLGVVNRDPGLSMRPPKQSNAPKIAIGPTGNGLVSWQEPEADGVARIWARRIFGQSLDYVMPVTANILAGAPIASDADAPSVAISRLGQADVAYRQTYAAGSPLPGPRIFLNTLADGESESGAQFLGAKIADTAVEGGRSAVVGRPTVDVDERRETRVLYDSNGAPRVVLGNNKGQASTVALGPAFVGSALESAAELASVSVVNPQGGGISAWPSSDPQGRAGVAVREDFPDGAAQTGLISGGAGGPIAELAVGRSGLGDGLVAFQQGPLGNAAIVAAQVTAPPEPFVVSLPKTWIRPSQARIAWVPTETANGPVSYSVVLDGRVLSTPPGVLRYSLERGALSSGIHHVQVLASDIFGQAVLSAVSPLKVDGRPPTVTIARAATGRGVQVRVADSGAGVNPSDVSVSFGDGRSGGHHRRIYHSYTRPGVYLVTVRARDSVGNATTVRRSVRVR